MTKKKKILLAALCLLAVAAVVLGVSLSKRGPVSKRNQENFGILLADLADAARNPSEERSAKIEEDLKAVEKSGRKDAETAKALVSSWKEYYLDPDYVLNLYKGEEKAEGLENSGIPSSGKHAVVVLGYELMDGEMQDELKGRCEAAAALARRYPEAVLVCSGGATGDNNPEAHTEAGLMKEYLSSVCGIDAERILTDEEAMTTQENAVNSFRILQKEGIKTMTIVTSSYHQRWGQCVYAAVAEQYRQKYGYPVEIVSNYCYDIGPSVELYKKDVEIAVFQIAGILELSEDARKLLPNPFI